MNRILILCSLFLFVFTTQCSYFAEPAAEVTLPTLFTDNMVLQQDISMPVWGTASPDGKVTVLFNGQKKATVADENGDWRINLNPVNFGGPFTLKIIGKDTTTLSNVMVGEVWICSGQSNMEMPLAGWGEIFNFEEEIAGAA